MGDDPVVGERSVTDPYVTPRSRTPGCRRSAERQTASWPPTLHRSLSRRLVDTAVKAERCDLDHGANGIDPPRFVIVTSDWARPIVHVEIDAIDPEGNPITLVQQ